MASSETGAFCGRLYWDRDERVYNGALLKFTNGNSFVCDFLECVLMCFNELASMAACVLSGYICGEGAAASGFAAGCGRNRIRLQH